MRALAKVSSLRRGVLGLCPSRRLRLLSAKAGGEVSHAYELTATGAGVQLNCRFQPSGHVVSTDLPKALGGRDTAAQPVELLLASLCGCEQATAAFVARHMKPRFPLSEIEFRYQAERNPTGANFLPLLSRGGEQPVSPMLQSVQGKAIVRTRGPETPPRLSELAQEVHARCPVHQTLLAAGVKMEIDWVLAS